MALNLPLAEQFLKLPTRHFPQQPGLAQGQHASLVEGPRQFLAEFTLEVVRGQPRSPHDR